MAPEDKAMTDQPEYERPVTLTCPTCGGAVRQASEGGALRFACHRMFNERAELARRLAATQRKHARPVTAEHWEATAREMGEAAEALRRFIERDRRRPDPEGGSHKPDAAQG